MKQYRIRYNKTRHVVLAIIIVPLLFVPLFISMAYWNIPGWATFPIIFAVMAAGVICTRYAITKISPKAMLIISPDGFTVTFLKKDIVTPDSFEIKTSEISNFYEEETKGDHHLHFTTTVAPHTFNIAAAGKTAEDEVSFAALIVDISTLIAQYNKVQTATGFATPVANVTIYERKWVKALIVFAMITLLAFAILSVILPSGDKLIWLRLVVIAVMILPFALKIFIKRRA